MYYTRQTVNALCTVDIIYYPKYELCVLIARSKVKISSMAFPVDDTTSTPLLEHGQDVLAGKV